MSLYASNSPLLCSLLALTIVCSLAVDPPKGGGDCVTEKDCHFGGVCARGKCVCDATWTDLNCQMLHVLPARVGSGYPTHPATDVLPANTSFTWGGHVVQDSDGLYHGFFTTWMNQCPMTYATWQTQTNIQHAVSTSPDGPWTDWDIAVPSGAGNPVVSRAPDGTYLLYFTNHRWDGGHRNCFGPVANWTAPVYCKDTPGQCMGSLGISLAHSKSLRGPWTIKYDVVTFGSTNPGAPIFFPNGSMIMAYKTWTREGRCIGLLTAPRWDAFPYVTFPDSSTPQHCAGVAAHLEDPSNLWQDKRGNIHMLYHSAGYGGSMSSGDGGFTWDYNVTRVAYNYTMVFEDGSVTKCGNREEPKVLMDASGKPSMLINVCLIPTLKLPPTAPTKQYPHGEAQWVTRVLMQPINTADSESIVLL